jgi:hypothetical protein
MVVEEKKQRPKSSGLPTTNSSAAIHRVKYIPQPATAVKSKLPKQVENQSLEEKHTPR